MKNLICLATGNLARWFWPIDINKILEVYRKLEIDGVELTFNTLQQFLEFEPAKANIKFLQNLKYRSIHAPLDFYFDDSFKSKIVIRKIKELYKTISADNLVIHPDKITDYNMVRGMNISTENLAKRKNIGINRIAELLEKYPWLRLVLDTTHALSYSEYKAIKMIKMFEDRISEIHLSDINNGRGHYEVSECRKMARFSYLRTIDVPIVIESMIKVSDINRLEREIRIVRNFFSG